MPAPPPVAPARPALREAVGLLFGVAASWGLWRFGATEVESFYTLFLVLALLTLIALSQRPPRPERPGALPLFVIGGVLLAQVALQPTTTGQGYVLLALGWLTLVLTLWLTADGLRTTWAICASLVLLGLAEAAYGLVQSLAGVDAIGSYDRGSGRLATGTFINRNHFSGLLNMTLPFAIGSLFAGFGRAAGQPRRGEAYARSWMVLLGCSLIGLAVLLSRSRAGILSLTLTTLFLGALIHRQRARSGGGLPAAVAALPLVVVLGLGLWTGNADALARFRSITESERAAVFAGTARLIADHPLLGVGPGMYRWRFPPYQSPEVKQPYHHVHNDYLETAAEWGLPAALLFWGFVLWRFRGAIRTFNRSGDPVQQGVALGAAGAILSVLIHSLIDFNLQIPLNRMVFCAVLGIAWGLEQRNDSHPRDAGRTPALRTTTHG